MGDWQTKDEDVCEAQWYPKGWAPGIGIAYKPAATVVKHWFEQPDRTKAEPMPLKADDHVEVGETDPDKILEQFNTKCLIPKISRIVKIYLPFLIIAGIVAIIIFSIRKIRHKKKRI